MSVSVRRTVTGTILAIATMTTITMAPAIIVAIGVTGAMGIATVAGVTIAATGTMAITAAIATKPARFVHCLRAARTEHPFGPLFCGYCPSSELQHCDTFGMVRRGSPATTR